jgi:DNA polymerase III gamma/tau subunit
VSKFLGIASDALIEDMITSIRGGDFEKIVASIENCTEKGIDLHHFAKQMILYLDAHLLEDTEFFIRLSSAFTEILQTVRHYAYPAIVYKIVLYNFLNPNAANAFITPQQPTPSPAPKQPDAPISPIEPEKKSEAPAPSNDTTPVTSNDTQSLWNTLITRIDKDNLKHAIQDHATISKVENGMVSLSVINKMSQMMINNPENK